MQKRILLVRFSALGDLVLTTGPLRMLRDLHPACRIDLLTSEIGEELYLNNPNLDDIYVVPKGSGLLTLIRTYRSMENYDLIIDWQDNFKSRFVKLFLRGTVHRIHKQPKKRRIFVKKRKYKEDLQRHVVEKYYDVLIKAFNFKVQPLERLRPWLSPSPLTFSKETFDFSSAIALHPYASQKNKEWPHFTQLAEELIKSDTPVVILGTSEEPLKWPESEKILDLTNRTTIREMASVLSKSKALVTTDSGPMHLGIAVKTPTLALFGPTTREFGFYPRFQNTRVLELEDLECRPCHIHGGDRCPLEHHDCMNKISVDQVINSLKEIPQ